MFGGLCGRLQKRISDTYDADDIRVELVFYSTFGPLDLPGSDKASAVARFLRALAHAHTLRGPILQCCGAHALDGRLMPLFVRGNSTLTIQHCFHNLQHSKFPHCCADASKESGQKREQRLRAELMAVEVGLGKRCLGGLSVEKTEERRIPVVQNGAKRGHAIRVKRPGSLKVLNAAAAQ